MAGPVTAFAPLTERVFVACLLIILHTTYPRIVVVYSWAQGKQWQFLCLVFWKSREVSNFEEVGDNLVA